MYYYRSLQKADSAHLYKIIYKEIKMKADIHPTLRSSHDHVRLRECDPYPCNQKIGPCGDLFPMPSFLHGV